MGKVNRREFFEEVVDSQVSLEAKDNKEDAVFKKYANKEIPRGLNKTTSTLTPYTGPWTKKEIIHLLRRTTFGPKYEDVLYFETKNMNDAVDELLNVSTTAPAPPVNNYENTINDPHGVKYEQTWVNAPYKTTVVNQGTLNSHRRYSFKSWWINRMINVDRSIQEKMVMFWHNHFATEGVVVTYAQFMYRHNALLRQHALGNFQTLVKEVTKDTAMLRYLNGHYNTKTAPDENYARELMELFTLGKDYKPIYSENDIKAAAKVLTGWRNNYTTLTSYFSSSAHDTTNKQFSSFFGNKVIFGKTGTDGAKETDELIDMIFQKQEVARFIVRKLYRYFVYYVIDSNTEADIITPLAQDLMFNNFEIKPILTKLLKSEHFFDVLSQACYIKTPLDYVMGTFRTFDVKLPVNFGTEKTYKIHHYLRYYTSLLNMEPNEPPNVAGWPAFYQTPEYYETWINSTTLPRRLIFTDMMLGSGFSYGTGTAIKVDPMEFAKKFYSPGDPNLLIDYFCSLLLGLPISSQNKISLKQSTLLSGQTSDYYWTNAWSAYIGNPNTANTNIVKSRLNGLLIELTRLPEHQLC